VAQLVRSALLAVPILIEAALLLIAVGIFRLLLLLGLFFVFLLLTLDVLLRLLWTAIGHDLSPFGQGETNAPGSRRRIAHAMNAVLGLKFPEMLTNC
jgi:hypothetical protein